MMLQKSHFHTTRRIDDEYGLNEQWIETKGMLLVNIWAEWSIQCHNMFHVMRNIQPLLHDKDTIVYIDWHHQKEWVNKLGVFGVPTLIIFLSGQEVARFSGTMSTTALMRHISIIARRIFDR